MLLQQQDDCDDCVPDYLRHSTWSTVASQLPFAITFVLVAVLAFLKIFPQLSTSQRDVSSGAKSSTSKQVGRIWSKPKVEIASALSFALTIGLSAVLTELILCEISSTFSAAARKTALNVALPSLLLLLVFFLPLIELYSVITSAGWRFRGEDRRWYAVAWILELLGFSLFVLAFWTIGAVLPDHSARFEKKTMTSGHNVVEGSLERLGVAGVTLMALLSGFAAVSAIWQMVGQRAVLVKDTDITRKVAGLETTREMLESKKERRRNLRRKQSEAPETSIWSKAVNKIRPNLDVQEMKALDMEISGLETMVDSLELSLSAMKSRQVIQARNSTAVGRLLNTFSYIFACYCIYRIITTTINFIRRQFTGVHTTSTSDPVTMFIALFAKHINPAMDQTMWAQHISFLLAGVILMTSFSAVIQTIHLFSRVTPRKFLHIARSNAPLVIAQICGTYVISSALMLRGTMPREVGNVINDALGAGALDAGWVQKWFDMFFIGAVILTSQGLWVGRKFGGRESWDDETWDDDIEMGKRL